MLFEMLLVEAEDQGIEVREHAFKCQKLRGLYVDNVITLNVNIPTQTARNCILAEELGHHHTTNGIIIDQSKLENRKQEQRARNWAYERLVPLTKVVQAYKVGVRNRYELSEYLEVTEDFLEAAIMRYRVKYGKYVVVNNHTLSLDPLGVIEMID